MIAQTSLRIAQIVWIPGEVTLLHPDQDLCGFMVEWDGRSGVYIATFYQGRDYETIFIREWNRRLSGLEEDLYELTVGSDALDEIKRALASLPIEDRQEVLNPWLKKHFPKFFR